MRPFVSAHVQPNVMWIRTNPIFFLTADEWSNWDLSAFFLVLSPRTRTRLFATHLSFLILEGAGSLIGVNKNAYMYISSLDIHMCARLLLTNGQCGIKFRPHTQSCVGSETTHGAYADVVPISFTQFIFLVLVPTKKVGYIFAILCMCVALQRVQRLVACSDRSGRVLDRVAPGH